MEKHPVHRSLPFLLLPLVLALAACPGASQGDAGTDAGPQVDSGTPDAGAPDAGTPDAGAPDAGPPPELKIASVLPPRAPTAGGVYVAITGSGFVRGVAERATEAEKRTTIKFGSNPSQDFQIIDDGTIDVRVPPGSTGLTNVSIENTNGTFVCSGCFTYFEEVFLKSATPKEGPLRGGTEVTLTGGGLTPELQILFGNQSATDVTLVSNTELKVTAPRAVAAGPVDITAYSKNGVGVLRRVFRYYDDLRVTAIAPLTGPLGGGTSVVITGQGFDGATAVTFGGVPAASFTVNSSNQLTAVTPPGAGAGAVPVTITTPRDSWAVRDGFTYVSGGGFAVYGVSPHLGPEAGGNTVTITGEGLDRNGVAFGFGGAGATVVSVSANEATVSVPARGASARKVDVTAQDGAQTLALPQGYTYRLSLGAISPNQGPIAGGTAARVDGSALPQDVELRIGSALATVQGTPTELSVDLLTPAGQGGTATDLWAREASDPENEFVLEDAFTYAEQLSVGRVQPDRGAIAGGTLVSVLGSGFGEGTLVRFGNYVAKDIKVIDSHTLTCRTPKADQVGSVTVEVERLGAKDPLPGGFSYFDPRSISGGLSGAPLTGTLNVSVLDASPQMYGAPVPLATVMLGVDEFTPFQGQTDARGQITFSDPSLVKAQTVTIFKEGYESATVTSVNAENLTVFISRTGGDGDPSPPPAVPPSVISGHVTGFKPPWPLSANESLEARVFIAQTSLFGGAPFAGPPNRTGQKWQVTADGGQYLLYTRAGLRAVYAILGVFNKQNGAFTPYLMGVKRGVTVSADQPATDQDIVLDMHLDMTVRVTIDQPLDISGGPATNDVYGWLDLGAEGFIPNPNNWGAGISTWTSVSSVDPSLDFPNFPRLDGSNFIFMNLAYGPQGIPYSAFFRRQPGDLTQGVKIGPMLPTATFTSPSRFTAFTGTLSWTSDPGVEADIQYLQIFKPTLTGSVVLWSIVLPGSEKQVTLPPLAVQKLQDEEAGNTLYVQIISSRSPKFAYNQWTYDTLSGVTWSSFAIGLSDGFLP